MDTARLTQPGSVDQFRDRFARFGAEGLLYPFVIGTIEAIVTDLHRSDAEKVRQICNALIAAGPATTEPDPTGLAYTRVDDEADDPTPVSPARVPLHTGAMTDEGLVDETGERWHKRACHGDQHCVCAAC